MPVNPGAHVHSYESSLEVHSAPFLHGPEAQWSSNSQLGPENKEEKTRVKKQYDFRCTYIYIFILYTARRHITLSVYNDNDVGGIVVNVARRVGHATLGFGLYIYIYTLACETTVYTRDCGRPG